MKLILLFLFHLFYIAESKDTSSCNKLWETTNSINNVPLYSMKIYACVETPDYTKNTGVLTPIVHNHIKNHTNELFKNIPSLNLTNSTLLNKTNNDSFIFLSNSTNNKHLQNKKNKTNNITTTNASKQVYFNNETTSTGITSPISTTTTPSPISATTTTKSTTTPSPTPSPIYTTTTSTPMSSKTTPSPISTTTTQQSKVSTTQNKSVTLDKETDSSNINKDPIKQTSNTESSLLYVTIILAIIVGIILIFSLFKCIRFCILKKKCNNILKKTIPEKNKTKNSKNDTKDEIISHELDDMEKAKLRNIETKKSMGIYKKKIEYAKGARWKRSVKKVRKINTINRSLTQQNVPANRHVRNTVREDLIRQSKAIPNGENNATIQKLIKRLDDADREEEKREETQKHLTIPPLPSVNLSGKQQPTRKQFIDQPGNNS